MPKNDDKFTDFAKEVWGKRAEGLPVPGFDITRPPSHDDVLYMLQRYAFVQIINSAPNQELSSEIRFVRTKSNWMVFDYETAMCTAPREALFGNERYRIDEGKYERLNTGTGTIVKQIVDTAAEMVLMAQKKGWERIHIVAGQALMKWAVWAVAKKLDIEVTGYIPSEKDIAKYNRIKQSEFKSIIEPILSKLKLKPK